MRSVTGIMFSLENRIQNPEFHQRHHALAILARDFWLLASRRTIKQFIVSMNSDT
jgi:hypothetical protein